jgi:hypothetical protein
MSHDALVAQATRSASTDCGRDRGAGILSSKRRDIILHAAQNGG